MLTVFNEFWAIAVQAAHILCKVLDQVHATGADTVIHNCAS